MWGRPHVDQVHETSDSPSQATTSTNGSLANLILAGVDVPIGDGCSRRRIAVGPCRDGSVGQRAAISPRRSEKMTVAYHAVAVSGPLRSAEP